MDTIFALASAQGKAGVSVVRISGPSAKRAVLSLCHSLPESRQAATRRIVGADGVQIDTALVLVFDGPGSFTGEDVVELQLHGSTAVVSAVLSELSQLDDLRQAEPGEFTRRALENSRLDLAQVEGLADLIDAETEAQRRQALRVLNGALGDVVERWRAKLIKAASLLEATIDFADEDVPVDVTPDVNALLSEVRSSVAKEIAGTYMAERIRHGIEVAIVGPPNSGKSTLLNYLAGREAAITSEVAGTTRDVIEVRMDIGGYPVTLLDTAGLRKTDDVVEEIGISRAIARSEQADIRLILARDVENLGIDLRDDDIVLSPKSDLSGNDMNAISGKTGAGVAELLERLESLLSTQNANASIAIRERHRVAMAEALGFLDRAIELMPRGADSYDIAAEELRSSIRSLETLVGRVDVENLLDEIFSSFCIGK